MNETRDCGCGPGDLCPDCAAEIRRAERVAVIEAARRCELARDLQQLAGLLTEYRRPDPEPARRPVTTVANLP